MSALVIKSLMPVLQSAFSVVAAFKGSAATAKTTSGIQDAIQIIGAVVPLVQQFGAGQEVTPEEARAALGTSTRALIDFDDEIARQSQDPP